MRGSAGAKTYYQQIRARGTGHQPALRQLANRWVGILHGCLKYGTTYGEDTASSHIITPPLETTRTWDVCRAPGIWQPCGMVAGHSTSTRSRPAIICIQTGLALLAAAVLGLRTVRTAIGQAVPQASTTAHLFGAVLTGASGALAVAVATFLLAGRRRPAAVCLAVTLGLELFVLDLVAAPPRLVTALPLGLALALFLATRPGRDARVDESSVRDGSGAAAPARPLRTAAAVSALVLMLPTGFLYLMSGLVVPAPDLFAMYALFAGLLVGAVLLARRRSWWVLGVPPAAVGVWFLLIRLGGQYWGWQP